MPDDVGGRPFADGDGPDSQDSGAADEMFAAVVLDEEFVEAAEIHEPTAAERILYAALERAESEAAEEPGFYRDPEGDLGSAEGPTDFEIAGPGTADTDPAGTWALDDAALDQTALDDAALDEALDDAAWDEALDGLDGEGPDDEGRFDRSDYTRYLPAEDDEEPASGPADAPDAPGPHGLPGPPGGAFGAPGAFGPQAPYHALGPRDPYGPYDAHAPRIALPGAVPAGRGPLPPRRPGRPAGASPPPAASALGRPVRWQRPVACVLAMVMGISMIAFAVVAVQRAGPGDNNSQAPGWDSTDPGPPPSGAGP